MTPTSERYTICALTTVFEAIGDNGRGKPTYSDLGRRWRHLQGLSGSIYSVRPKVAAPSAFCAGIGALELGGTLIEGQVFPYVVVALASLGLGYLIRRFLGELKKGSAEQQARSIIEEAEKLAEAKQREMLLEVKEDIHRLRTELDRESRERRLELQRAENRNIQKEEALDRKLAAVEKREERIAQREAEIEKLKREIEQIKAEQRKKLEEIADLTTEQARQLLLDEVRKETEHEAAAMIKSVEIRARDEADKRAREIVSLAIQRCGRPRRRHHSICCAVAQ